MPLLTKTNDENKEPTYEVLGNKLPDNAMHTPTPTTVVNNSVHLHNGYYDAASVSYLSGKSWFLDGLSREEIKWWVSNLSKYGPIGGFLMRIPSKPGLALTVKVAKNTVKNYLIKRDASGKYHLNGLSANTIELMLAMLASPAQTEIPVHILPLFYINREITRTRKHIAIPKPELDTGDVIQSSRDSNGSNDSEPGDHSYLFTHPSYTPTKKRKSPEVEEQHPTESLHAGHDTKRVDLGSQHMPDIMKTPQMAVNSPHTPQDRRGVPKTVRSHLEDGTQNENSPERASPRNRNASGCSVSKLKPSTPMDGPAQSGTPRTPLLRIVSHDYSPQRTDELCLRVGQQVHVVQSPAGGWWEGTQTATGQRGWFPCNHTEECKEETDTNLPTSAGHLEEAPSDPSADDNDKQATENGDSDIILPPPLLFQS
eukprot:m.173679 g.173679  ORF g.173679 m.173679 type:complete len:426 (-) comp15392_c0_seq4:5-1282(-)